MNIDTPHRGLGRLRPLLPGDLQELETTSPNNALGKPDSFEFFDGQSHQSLGVAGVVAKGDPPLISANRNTLRQILSQHLDIKHGKRFVQYLENREGITVFFEDGSTARGSVLVGADGSNSRIRAQLLGGFEGTLSPYVMFQGNVTLSHDDYERILRNSNTGAMFGAPRTKCYILLLDRLSDGKALFNWAVAYRSTQPDVDHAWAQSASAQALYDAAAEKVQGLPPYLVAAVKQTGAEGMHTPPNKMIETVLPADSLPNGRVTLVGDAAHSMVRNTSHPVSDRALLMIYM